MKTILLLITVLFCFSSVDLKAEGVSNSSTDNSVQKTATPDNEKIDITYTICEGFIVEVGDKKILLDVLDARRFLKHQSVPDSLIRRMENVQQPFDNVDVIFTTHAHLDHFDPDLIVQYMETDTNVHLVCPQQAFEIIKTLGGSFRVEDRIHPIPYQPLHAIELEVKGINIKCMPLSHAGVAETDPNPEIQNLGYLINLNSRTILHTGDNDMLARKSYEKYELNKKKIDVAFLQALFWNEKQFDQRRKIVEELIAPENIVYMHLMQGQNLDDVSEKMKDAYPTLTYFKNCLEKKVF